MNSALLISLLLIIIGLPAEARTFPTGKTGQLIERDGYALQYNSDCKIPHWVSYKMRASDLINNVKRTNDFRADSALKGNQAQLDDYRRSGYNRGHMARAGLFTQSRKLMSESFILSNILPQDPYMNQNGAWRKLEDFEFESIKTHQEVMIVSGPVLDANMQRIGANEVCVPNYLYKVIVKTGAKPAAIAFVIPNFRTSEGFASYAVSVDDLEKLTGLDFLHELPSDVEKKLEASFDFENWK